MSRIPENPSFGSGSSTPRELSEDLGRIASNLAKLAIHPGEASDGAEEVPANDYLRCDLLIETVGDLIHARRIRRQFFDEMLFAEPAWDLLLEMFHAEISGRRISVQSLCDTACVPPTTAKRWISAMIDTGLCYCDEAVDREGRNCVELSPKASQAMYKFIKALGKPHAS